VVTQEWAKNTGRWKEGDPEPNYAQLKTRLRCAFNKAPDIDEIKELHCTKSEEPYKVYRFTERRGDVYTLLVNNKCTLNVSFFTMTETTCSVPHSEPFRSIRRPPRHQEIFKGYLIVIYIGNQITDIYAIIIIFGNEQMLRLYVSLFVC